jgi:hypothetical protein
MRKQLLYKAVLAIPPLAYMATVELRLMLVTSAAVMISILAIGLISSRKTSQSYKAELSERLARRVRALVDRDLESEIFNLSSQVEAEIKRDLDEIDASLKIDEKSLNLKALIPISIFVINGLIPFFISDKIALENDEALFALGSMMVLAHLSSITPTHLLERRR